MKDEVQLIALFNKYLADECSLEEVEELMQYFNSDQQELLNEEVFNEFEALEQQHANYPQLPKRVFEGIRFKIAQTKASPLQWRLWPRIAVAASIAVAIMTGGYFYYTSQTTVNQTSIVAHQNDVAPGKNGATLTLANGQKILINDATAGDLATQSGVKITKTADGGLIYEVTDDDSNVLAYNTLATGRGEQTRVCLPDGTLVFLNAASTLKYRTSFGKERNVELIGEAYFKVAHNKKKPFTVTSNGQVVEVLGTHFNINSYADENYTKTTLLEGAVRLNGNTVLKPGEQATLSKTGEVSVEQVSTDNAIAWTDGNFVFDEESLESIMRKISRWYDVEVVYRNKHTDINFFGSVSRAQNLSSVLNGLEKTGKIHFKIEGKKITVL